VPLTSVVCPRPIRPAGAGLGERLDRWSGKLSILSRNRVRIRAEPVAQLDLQSLAAQSVDVLVGRPSLIAGKLTWSFGGRTKEHRVVRKLENSTRFISAASIDGRFDHEKFPPP
jgi:hypothetical protein